MHDFIAVPKQRVEGFFGKGRLSDERDTQYDVLPSRKLPNRSGKLKPRAARHV